MNRLRHWLSSCCLLCHSVAVDLGCTSDHKPPHRSLVGPPAHSIDKEKGSSFGSTDYKDVLDISPENNFIHGVAYGSRHDHITSPPLVAPEPISSDFKDGLDISPENHSIHNVAGGSRHDNHSAPLIPRISSIDFNDVLDISAENNSIDGVAYESRYNDASPPVIPSIAPTDFNDVLDISPENNFIQSFAGSSPHENPLSHPIPHASSRPPSPPWHRRLAVSFSAMAEQMKTFSQAVEHLSVEAHLQIDPEATAIQSRVEALEKKHQRLSAEFGALENHLSRLGASLRLSDDGLETKIDNLTRTFNLDQLRLYARLHNARVTSDKTPIKPLIMSNGKIPRSFPVTKGEFEHLSKQEYELILRAYDLPIPEDAGSRRQILRIFMGLP